MDGCRCGCRCVYIILADIFFLANAAKYMKLCGNKNCVHWVDIYDTYKNFIVRYDFYVALLIR